MAKLPPFGQPENTGSSSSQRNQEFKLPAFKAPKAPAVKLPRAPRISAPAVPAPTQTQAPTQAPSEPGFLEQTWNESVIARPLLSPIISAASAIFNTLGMGMAKVNGYDYAQANDNNQGLITSDDVRDAAFNGRKINGQKVEIVGFENGQAIYNIQPNVTDRAQIQEVVKSRNERGSTNATAWLRGEQTLYGGDVMAEWGKDTTPGALGISEAERVGFARDLLLDPINFIPFGTIGKLGKAGAQATKGAYEATKLAAKGEVSTNVAELLGKSFTEAPRITQAPANISPQFRGIADGDTNAALYIKEAQDKLRNKYSYSSAKIADTMNPIAATTAVVGSGIEAGYKALASSLIKLNMNDFLKAYAKRDVTRKGVLKLHIIQRGPNDYRVLTGNGVEKGRASSRVAAREILAAEKFGISAAGLKVRTADDVTQAKEAVEAEYTLSEESITGETAKMPTEVEANKSLELYEPYEGKDGKWYIFDGKKIVRTRSLEDAQRYIEADLYTEAQFAAPEAVKVGKNWQVRLGDSVYTYKTKAEADAFIKAAADNTLPDPVSKKKSGPAVDTAPSPMALADVLKVPAKTEEASALKKILGGLDKVAKTARGVKPVYAKRVKERITDILRSGESIANETKILAQVSDKVLAEIDAAIKLDGTNPFALLDSVSPQLRAVMGKMLILDKDGIARTLDTVAAVSKAWKAGSPTADIKASVIGELENLKKRIAAAKSGKASGPDMKYDLIKAEFGAEIADRLKETGIYGPFTTRDEARAAVRSFDATIDGLIQRTQEVKFSGIEDLINQTRTSGVVVDEDSLMQIFKLIDPTNTVITKAEEASTQSSNIYLLNELFRAEGIQTIEDTQIKLAHFGNFDNLIKSSGISDDLLLAQLIKDIRNPEGGRTTDFVDRAVAKESKQAMAERINSADPQLLARALEGVADANAEAHAKIQTALASGAGLETLDTWGRVVVRSTAEAYDDASQAVLKRTFNQVRERKLFSVISALNRNAQLRTGKALDRQKLLDDTIEGMDLASDSLGLLDIRITSTKFRNDEDFVAAFEKAKASKKKFNPSKDGNFAYLHMGDMLRVFKDTGANDLLLEAFFPPKSTTGNKTPTNYLSTQAFSDAARQALEMRSKNKPLDVDQLTARILNSGLNTNLYTKSFRDRYKDLARELAEHLVRDDVLEGLSAAHLEKSLGMAQKWIDQAQSVSDDLQRLLYDAWQANLARGDLSDEARVTLIRSYLRKILYVSDTFRIEGGAIAESAIRSISNMVLRRGLIRTPNGASDTAKMLDDMELQSMRKVINSLYLYEKPQFAMRPGQVKFANEATKATVTKRLEGAEFEYEEIMKRVNEQFDPSSAVRQAFSKARGAAQAKLDRARLAAVEIGLSTRHYSGTKGWVPSEKFNYESEVRNAQRRLLNYEAAKAGVVAREQFIADSRPVRPESYILNSKQRKAFLERERLELVKTNMENAASRIQNAEETIIKMMDNKHLESKGIPDDVAAEMYLQQNMALSLMENTQHKVTFPTELAEPAILVGSGTYGKAGRVVEGISRGERISELLTGTSSREDVKGLMQKVETGSHKRSATYAAVVRAVATTLRDTPPSIIEDAFDYVKAGEVPPPDVSPQVLGAYGLLQRAWAPLIGSIEESIFTLRGINGDMLADAMENMGLTAANGFPSPAGLSQTQLSEFLLKMPFGKPKLPAGTAPDSQRGREFLLAFDDNKALATKAGANPLIFMERLMQATQNVLFQKGLAEEFVARYSYKTEKLTYQQAIDREYVELKEVFGNDGLLRYLPEPKDGGLFPPELGKQFFSMMREYNQMFNSLSAERLRGPKWEALFTAVGGIKAFQTILNLRHHVQNFVGDSLIAMTRGVYSPGHWGPAARMSTKLAMRRAGSSYFINQRVANNPDTIEILFRDLFRAMEGQGGRTLEGIEGGKKVTGVVIYENGKPVRRNLSDDDMMDLFEEWGIFEESIYQEDIQGLVDYVESEGIAGGKAALSKRLAANARKGLRFVTKAPGDFTAGYGNISRGAHALKLLQGRTWPSLEIALDTVAKEIALYHPTAKSLTSFERQWGRFATSYYTWMRMAHIMVIKMMAENTRGVVAAEKLIGEWNREQLQQEGQRPINRSTAYAGDPNQMPAYLTSTSGTVRLRGALLQDILAPVGIDVPQEVQDATLSMNIPLPVSEVSNFWKADFDPYRSLEYEIVNGLTGEGGYGMNPGALPVLGKNISMIGEPLIGLLTNKDPSTGKDLQLESFGDVFNFVVGDKIPQLRAINTLVDPNASEADKFMVGFRNIVGLGAQNPQNEANQRNAINQFNKRTADSIDRIIQMDGIPKQGSALWERLNRVAENILREQEEENKK